MIIATCPLGEDFHIKERGYSSEMLIKQNPYEVPRSCFVGVAWNFSHP